MPGSGESSRGGRRFPAAALVVLVVGVLMIVQGIRGDRPPAPSGAAAAGIPPGAVADPLPRSLPARLDVGRIDVRAPVRAVGLDEDGSVEVPPGEDDEVGWYSGGVTPGENGTAVMVGHVDDEDGPAVFHRLGSLLPGHTVEVRREDGVRAVFTVRAVRVYLRANFPDEQVYGPTGRPELRLITCGGPWSGESHYTGNTVVFAYLSGTR